MIKITKDMVSFWLGSPSRRIIIKDLTDIANGDYPLKMLQQDIIDNNPINVITGSHFGGCSDGIADGDTLQNPGGYNTNHYFARETYFNTLTPYGPDDLGNSGHYVSYHQEQLVGANELNCQFLVNTNENADIPTVNPTWFKDISTKKYS